MLLKREGLAQPALQDGLSYTGSQCGTLKRQSVAFDQPALSEGVLTFDMFWEDDEGASRSSQPTKRLARLASSVL
jgi:hypothetical protein